MHNRNKQDTATSKMFGRLGMAGHIRGLEGKVKKKFESDAWFTNPTTLPAAEKIFKGIIQKWSAGEAKDIVLDGNLSRGDLESWFADLEDRVVHVVADSRENGGYFSSPHAERGNDPDRRERWKNFFLTHPFDTNLPDRHRQEPAEHHAILAKELEHRRNNVSSSLANFVLNHACNSSTRVYITRGLVRRLGPPTSTADVRAYRMLRKLVIADAAPERLQSYLTQNSRMAEAIAKGKVDQATSRLHGHLRLMHSSLLKECEVLEAHELINAHRARVRRESGPDFGASDSEDDEGGARVQLEFQPSQNIGPAEFAEAVEEINWRMCSRWTTFLTYNHLIDTELRRKWRLAGKIMLPDGQLQLEDFDLPAGPGENEMLHAQCTAVAERKSRRRNSPAQSQSATKPASQPSTHEKRRVTLVATDKRAPDKKRMRTICWHCDADGNTPKDGTRCGHATRDCPHLDECELCGRKHTPGWCTRQKAKKSSSKAPRK